MSTKEKNIVDAAVQVFLRYGVKRASMQDIASEAGIARQTLYNTYSNKDEILRASIRFHTEDAIATIRAGIADADDLGAKLKIVFEELALKPYAALHMSPNAQDLIEGFNEAGRTELAEGAQQYRAVLTEILAPHADALDGLGLTPSRLAELLQRAGSAFKYQAESEAHLTELLDGLVTLAVATVGDLPKVPQNA